MCEIQTGLDVVCFGERPAAFAPLLMLADRRKKKNATPFSFGLVRIVSIMIHLHVPSVQTCTWTRPSRRILMKSKRACNTLYCEMRCMIYMNALQAVNCQRSACICIRLSHIFKQSAHNQAPLNKPHKQYWTDRRNKRALVSSPSCAHAPAWRFSCVMVNDFCFFFLFFFSKQIDGEQRRGALSGTSLH